MTKKKKKKESKEPRPSAVHMVPGMEGGHDGMPGRPLKKGKSASPAPAALSTKQYVDGVLAGDRTMIGRAVTLIESNAKAHQEQAQEVLAALLPRAGGSIRVGISGVPGAGKSTFIEALGTNLAEKGLQVAVLAVDPSSHLSKGSILGDKTRMERLARNPKAFIRPSPTGGILGGVARKTRETILLFEAAGYKVVIVETVGVGQSEIAVRSMVDFFLLILVPGLGDELQGIKRGVIEIADAIVVNKADGTRQEAAKRARAGYAKALHYLQPATPGWTTGAYTASALHGEGVEEIWRVIEAFREAGSAGGVFEKRRRDQARAWLHQMIEERLKDLFYGHRAVKELLPRIEKEIMAGTLPATRAAWRLLAAFEK